MPSLTPGDFRKKHPDGHTIGKGFTDNGFPEGLFLGVLTRVDEVAMKCDVKVIARGGQTVPEVDLTQGMCGPRSFWGGIPEVNSLVVLSYRKKHKQIWEPMILAFVSVGNKTGPRFDPYAPTDPGDIPTDPAEKAIYDQFIGRVTRYKKLKLRSGNVGGMSSDGAELILAKDVRMANRAGDLLELRDAERTLVTQAIHRFDSTSGIKRTSGPARRMENYLPEDIFSAGRTLRGEADRYFGSDELKAMGPGAPGSATKYSNAKGTVLDFFNDEATFPSTTYANGKKAFYPSTVYGTSIENGEAGGGTAFTEERLEMAHDTDLVQEVLAEVDGFTVSKRRSYIELVYGSVIGNDTGSTQGLRNYGKLLRPGLWSTFLSEGAGKFTLSEVERAAKGDINALTTAGAFLFQILCPAGTTDDNPFAVAIEKQGKVYLTIPKPTVERYPDDSGVSLEANILGAIKLFLGATDKNNTSLHAVLRGGIKAEIGHNKDTGNSIDVTYHSGVSSTFKGVDSETGYGKFDDVQGNLGVATGGDLVESVGGSRNSTVNGAMIQQADRISMNAFQGLGINVGQLDVLVAQKSQYQYALAVLETIIAGGKSSTILAGGLIQNIVAGGMATTIAAGGSSTTVGAGGYLVSVGGGALTLTAAAGAVAITAGAGAVSLTAGAAISLTAGLAITLTSAVTVALLAPLISLGGPTAILGVCRGLPLLPPGVPTPDPISGTPLFGALTVLSN